MNILFCSSNKGKIIEFSNFLDKKMKILSLDDVVQYSVEPYQEPIENSNSFLLNATIKLISGINLASAFNKSNNKKNKINKVIVDDSGLCVPKLHFEPGVSSAFYAGIPRDDIKNRAKLIEKINVHKETIQLNQEEKRLAAFFVCFLMAVDITNLSYSDIENTEELKISHANFIHSEDYLQLEQRALHRIKNDGASISNSIPYRIDFQKVFPKAKLNFVIDIYIGYCNGFVSNQEQQKIFEAGHGYDCLFYGKRNPSLSFASISIEDKNKVSHRGEAMKAFASLIAV
ncbi:MAG: non-canonical purine NTP pyrophosphatase [Silvanigrellaceae bacterium]|nr:non-canonical purine NTP pyrophosphatase [Silvanigrellaceae bacterium]